MMWEDAFHGRSVLVTGHTGFKGSWLALWLARLGAKVSGYSLEPPTSPSNYVVSDVAGTLQRDLRGDVCDRQALTAAVAEVQPAIIFHLAAQSLVRESYSRPAQTFEINVMGSVNLLDAVRVAGKPCAVVMVTSDKCYENREQVWGYRECDPMGGGDPYSASKGAAELVVAAYRRSFFDLARVREHGIKIASVRAGNVIGGGDWAADRIVPDGIRALAAKQPIPVRSPASIRPWQHVLEPLSGYLELGARMLTSDDEIFCSGWNFGPLAQAAIPVSRLVALMIENWGEGRWEDRSSGLQPKEANVLRLAIEKADTLLQWRPRWTVEQAVAKTVSWYRDSLSGATGMRGRCYQDIDDYIGAR